MKTDEKKFKQQIFCKIISVLNEVLQKFDANTIENMRYVSK